MKIIELSIILTSKLGKTLVEYHERRFLNGRSLFVTITLFEFSA